MKVLVVGSGGREHALCWTIAASPLCDALYCAPGNPGIARDAECVPISPEDIPALVAFSKQQAIDLVVVGPEGPLAAGLVDRLGEHGIPAFGPTAGASALESSKAFTKDFCARHGIPTAGSRTFEELDGALTHLRRCNLPVVVKVDGLAAGKGVTVAASLETAEAAVRAAMEHRSFGPAGDRVVIEDFLQGVEASFFALSDGTTTLPLAAAQDHKRAGDGDTGPNTGGMGAFSPPPAVDATVSRRIMETIIEPAIAGMAAEGRPFHGVLFAGLMLTDDGPKLIEFNVRFGDPECQVLMARLRSDLLPALLACADAHLRHVDLRWSDDAAVCVVMASRGYPGPYRSGSPIRAVEDAESDPEVMVFHAGTASDAAGALVSSGGRVLGVTATGADVASARSRAYRAVERIDWPDGMFRTDIAATGAEVTP
ncbi:MAG: phosphoribosylamine--glycine ligase [Alphaproteobacteria bacterium]|nr:phosphoribosylamine--glycine ligase [Alphaproteobacteria bacterium]